MMKTQIVRVGNSKGVRIPKLLLDQTGLEGEVDIQVRQNSLVIRPGRKPRQGWGKAFREMAGTGNDRLLDDVANLSSFDAEEWEWR